jgi:hypothetical protein
MTTELKDRVRCWFECLRLAHRSTDPEVIRNLPNRISPISRRDSFDVNEINYEFWTEVKEEIQKL